MGEMIKQTGSELKGRWMGRMPRFFRQLVKLCACVMVTAFGINEIMIIGKATPHEWWNDVYPLLLAVPFGMICVCKLTVAGGYKEIDPDKVMQGDMLIGRDAQQPNMSDVETQQPGGMEPPYRDIADSH